MLTTQPDVVLRPRFKTFSAEIHPDEYAELRQVAELLKSRRVLHMHVAGHSDDVPISPRGRKVWADNYVLSLARARAVGDFLGEILGLGPDNITLAGRGPDEPVASNAIPEGRRLNRRVELRVVTETSLPASGDTVHDREPPWRHPHRGLRPSEAAARRAAATETEAALPEAMPTLDERWLQEAEPGIAWVWPTEDFRPSGPSTKVAIQHGPRHQIDLRAQRLARCRPRTWTASTEQPRRAPWW